MTTEDEVMRLLERADPVRDRGAAPVVDAAGYLDAVRTRGTTVTLIDTEPTPTEPTRRRWAIITATAAAVVAIVVGALVLAARDHTAETQIPAAPPTAAPSTTSTTTAAAATPAEVRSPVTDIKGRLLEGSEAAAFVVGSPTPSYWRLIALAEFDGTTWSLPESDLDDASGPLPPGFEPAVDGETVTQTFEITGLEGSLLPAAFSPVRVDGSDSIRFAAETSSLVNVSGTSDGLSYTVESVLPHYDVARLRAADAPPTGDIAERNLALPADFSPELADLAREITAGATTRYDRAIALQNWFRGFAYDLSVGAGQSQTAMQEFLDERRGYCEQFAATYAAFARVLGLPSRVAVGFTQGEQRDDGRYYVQGKHAHAWPEIYFDGVGWVPFEPTPGRGNPATEQYTGVATAQDNGDG